jgi:hypothetical protein
MPDLYLYYRKSRCVCPKKCQFAKIEEGLRRCKKDGMINGKNK